MRRLFRWLFRLLILMIVLAVALVLLKDTLVKALAEWQIHRRTGLDATIRSLEVGLFSPTLTTEGLKLFNPAGFGGTAFIEIQEVRFEYDFPKAMIGKARLRVLRVNLAELNIVRNQAGQTNLVAILEILERNRMAREKPMPQSSLAPTGQGTNQAPALQPVTTKPRDAVFDGIDRLYLSLGTVKFTDLGQPTQSWVHNIGWKDYETKDIRTSKDARNWMMRVLLAVAMTSPQPTPRPNVNTGGPGPARR
jgi:uncharacterized protein involved in outer membrane biogenesis